MTDRLSAILSRRIAPHSISRTQVSPDARAVSAAAAAAAAAAAPQRRSEAEEEEAEEAWELLRSKM